MRIAVIGGLASGPAAAAEAVRANPLAEVVLYEQSAHISVGACEIPYFVEDLIQDASTLEILRPDEFEEMKGATVCTKHRVEAIEPERGCLIVESLVHGSRHEERFDRFILATGARPRTLGVDGEDAEGVFTLRSLEEAVNLKAWLENEPIRHVLIVGGGFVGLELAEAVRHRGLQATLLDPHGRVLNGVLDDRMVQPLMTCIRGAGVAVRGERVTGIEADRQGRVSSVRTDAGERIGCQAVIVGIGVEARTDLAGAAGIKIGLAGGVVVDDQMRTSRRGVWACGDVIEVERVVDRKRIHWPLSPIARRTARVAARNAAGRTPADRFNGVTPTIGVRAFGMEAAAVGLSLEQAGAAGFEAESVYIRHWSRVSTMPHSKPLHVSYVVERTTGRLLGGTLVGEDGAALRGNVLVPWIRGGLSVKEIAEDMDLLYHPPLAPAVDALRIAASQAMRTLGRS